MTDGIPSEQRVCHEQSAGFCGNTRESAWACKSGKVLVQFTIEAGEIVDVQAVESTHPLFAEAAIKNIRTSDS